MIYYTYVKTVLFLTLSFNGIRGSKMLRSFDAR